jgi:hypothetical protein
MLDWAGMTAALIQERILDAIHETGEDQFVSCCVDGFWTMGDQSPNEAELRKLPDEEDGIGSWSRSTADELLLIRPMCYWKRTSDNGQPEWSAHTAGIPGGLGLVASALEHWEKPRGWAGVGLEPTLRRCKGLLACARAENFDQLGQFIDIPIRVAFNPGMGKMGHECPTQKGRDGWRRWLPYWPPVARLEAESAPFLSRTGVVDERWKERQEADEIEETED